MTYLSVCSGIEAASVAWEPLGWQAVGFSEVERFPCAVLEQRFPGVKNYGDMTRFREWENVGQFRVLVGGTPCQSFSVAGKRGGTNDIRGRLMYAYLGVVEKYKPRWILWENVPGVLSSGKGLDFASFLAGLEECGYGWAYRVLDAQFFGVPQRRRRVFVVGHADNRCDLAAKVLFEPESMCRNFTPSKEAGKEVAGTLTSGFGARGLDMDGIASGQYAIDYNAVFSTSSFGGYQDGIGTLRSSGGDNGFGSENVVLEKPVLASGKQTTGTLLAQCGKHLWQNNQEAFNGDFFVTNEQQSNIRRLTPIECERLQGFPDDWTRIAWRGKPADQCPDAPRYKAIGNSMAVPVMRWIGERIKKWSA